MICNHSLPGLFLFLLPTIASAIDYPYSTDEPQKSGWPLTAEERAYIVDKPEHDRRPGREANKHLPHLWPVVPSAGYFGGDAWLKLHEAHVKTVQANAGPVDVLLVGDSITIQWGESWKKHFAELKAINIGIGGDKTQNVLWRLDHGGVDGLQPKLILLMIGNNNMFFTPETGIEAVAKGIEMCVNNLREKFPKIPIIVVKILPAHEPGNRFYEDIKRTNAALDPVKLESNPNVFVLDLGNDFTSENGTIRKELFTSDNIHLSAAGYAVYAKRLEPMIDAIFNGKQLPQPVTKPKPHDTSATTNPTPTRPTTQPAVRTPKAVFGIVLTSSPVLDYPHQPYNPGMLDPQLTGWPLSDAELAWVQKPENTRKPGHEILKHLHLNAAGYELLASRMKPLIESHVEKFYRKLFVDGTAEEKAAAMRRIKAGGSKNETYGLTHHGNEPEKIAELRKIEEAQLAVFDEFLSTLAETKETGGSLLDHTQVPYGSRLGNANSHSNQNLSVLLAGGGFKHGSHLRFDENNNLPLANLFVTILRRLGIESDRFASSTGTIGGLED